MGKTNRPDLTVSRKQLVFLTMIAALAAVVAFLCGVQVGRGVEARSPAGPGSIPAAPPGDGALLLDAAEGADPPGARLADLSYFERLRGAASVPETLDFAAARGAAEPGRPEAAAAVPGGSFVVQVMSVNGAASALRVKADLEAKGYPVVVEPLPQTPGGLHRVHVGPFADRAAAEQARGRLEAEDGFDPWVVVQP